MRRLLPIIVLVPLLLLAANNGTVVGSPSLASSKFSNGLAGMTDADYVALPTAVSGLITANCTVEFWIHTGMTDGNIHIPLSFGGSWIGQVATGKVGGAFAGFNLTESLTSINDLVYHHVAVSIASGTTAKVFVDGVLESTTSGTFAAPGAVAANIGRLQTFGSFSFISGDIDEVAVWDHTHYTATFTPPSAPYAGSESHLVALYHLDSDVNDSAVGASRLRTGHTITQ